MLCTKIVLNVRNNFCTQHVLPRFELGIFMHWACCSMNNLLSYCGLVDAKIRASDKDLPVWMPGRIIINNLVQSASTLGSWCEMWYAFDMAFHAMVAITIFLKLYIHFDLNILWSQLTTHTHINSLRSVRRCGNCQANSSEKLSNEWLASTVYILGQ